LVLSEIILLGEDIKINVWTVTRDLYKEFGDRVINTPLSESGFCGAAVGAALTGMRPVVEVMYPDFTMYAADSIANQAAKYRYMCGGGSFKVPVVFRIAGGGSANGGGCHHGQSLEATFLHFPGLKAVFPSSPYDAKGLMNEAIAEDNPVMFVEHKKLYVEKGEVPEEYYTIPFGKAEVKKVGKDVTVFATQAMVMRSLKAAHEAEKEGIDIEVVDPRTLTPLDKETLFESIKKTGRLIVADEGHKTCGTAAEISAVVAEEAIEYLKAPVLRVCSPDTPVPFSPPLEQAYIPDETNLLPAIRRIMEYS